MCYVCVGDYRGQKRVLALLEWELHVAVNIYVSAKSLQVQ